VSVPPAALCLLAMATAGWENTLAGVLAAVTGPLAYVFGRRFSSITRARQSSPSSDPT
jgi:hypothetical protein